MRASVTSAGALNGWAMMLRFCLAQHPSSSQQLVGTALILEKPIYPPFVTHLFRCMYSRAEKRLGGAFDTELGGQRDPELHGELDLLLGKLLAKRENPVATTPGTYRGGIVTRLQRLLTNQTDCTFEPATDTSPTLFYADSPPSP